MYNGLGFVWIGNGALQLSAGPGFLNLKAIPNFQNGICVQRAFCKVWGEEITDAECFRRKLKGTLLDGIWEDGDD